jgi:nicotinamidase-related amidase
MGLHYCRCNQFLAFALLVLQYLVILLAVNRPSAAALGLKKMAATTPVTKAAARLLHVGKLRPETTALLVCDIQEHFIPLIWKSDTVVSTCRYMTSVVKALDVPILAMQQYTKAFGKTVPGCFATPDELEATPVYEKKLFSMITPEVEQKLSGWNKQSYIIVGIEAHVCVQQTCLELLERGKDVHVIVDGVSSQQVLDRDVALQRLQHTGAFLTTAQSAAFMLMQSADHANFKAVSKLTVDHMKLCNEFNEALKKSG